jgi:hypothetical protein
MKFAGVSTHIVVSFALFVARLIEEANPIKSAVWVRSETLRVKSNQGFSEGSA